MTNNQLQTILNANPTLCLYGFEDNLNHKIGSYGNVSTATSPMTEKWIPNIEKCIEWLSRQQVIRRFYADRYSQNLKVCVEQESKMYIPAGCMIVACIHLGIPWKRREGTPDILIPISTKHMRS
ncbi:MAG: hypothetical protein LCH52_16460 [Bacteroidetes bacterium]|nr:hypothetical protein [Bacteroidota bacterium]